MLIRSVRADEALKCFDVVEPERRIVGASEEIITGRMIGETAKFRGFIHVFRCLFYGGFGEIENLECIIASTRSENLRRGMKLETSDFGVVIVQSADHGMSFHRLFLSFFHFRRELSFGHHSSDVEDLDGGVFGSRGDESALEVEGAGATRRFVGSDVASLVSSGFGGNRRHVSLELEIQSSRQRRR